MTTNELLVLNTLSQEAFVMVNKHLVRFFKGDASTALFLSELMSAYKYHINNQTTTPDGAFAIPTRRYKIILGFSNARQTTMLTKITEAGLVNVRLQGYPAVKHVKIDFDKILAILSVNDMEIRHKEKANFYAELNEALNKYTISISTLAPIETACQNMMPVLRGSIILISKYAKEMNMTTNWTSELTGRVKSWGYHRSLGKSFDFSIISRAFDSLKSKTNFTSFDGLVKTFIKSTAGTYEVHHSKQVLNYTELL